ncbi:MAG: sigma-54-dependent transcriptional regulator, partial [Candidatus Zixiibacteriota bacterium]
MSGIELIGELLEREPVTQIIVLTAFGTVETAVAAMKAGAFHYQTKPVDLQELTANLEKAAAQYELLRDAARTEQALKNTYDSPEIIGASPAIEKVRELIELAGPSDSPTLITGPSGSGKELVARAVHAASARREGRFVAVNCGAFPESLLESELFGHERGAFTGAEKRKIGRFELADKGTLFLDEIGESPGPLQVKLLRALETHQIERLGSEAAIDLDLRVITATNAELDEAIKAGTFREDLYYRINVVRIEVPSLAERPEDILSLAENFLGVYARRARRQELTLTPEACKLLVSYHWPGNVRELQNLIERAVTLSRNDRLGPELFGGLSGEDAALAALPESLAEMEKRHIQRILSLNDGNIGVTADKLGIHRNTLTQKIKEYKLRQSD